MANRLFDDMPDGLSIPRCIRCYMMKRNPTVDYITVVFTHAGDHSGKQYRGRVVYRGYSGNPFYPLGFAQWGETDKSWFHPGGSRVPFIDLPKDTQLCVITDYADIWDLTNCGIDKNLVDVGNGWRINYSRTPNEISAERCGTVATPSSAEFQ